MSKRIISVLAIVMLAAGSLFVTQSSAKAYPGNCYAEVTPDLRGHASCHSGTGYYRVSVSCAAVWTFGYAFGVYSPWVAVGSRNDEAWASCPPGAWLWKPAGQARYYARSSRGEIPEMSLRVALWSDSEAKIYNIF